MSKTKLIIGMPVYNGEAFIHEALRSLLSQTFKDFEIIISDNASTDKTEEICRYFTSLDKRVRYFRQVENKGAFLNFKFVLDMANSEYFMWAASDDVWEENWLSEILPTVEKYQCLVYGRLKQIDEFGNTLNHPGNNRLFNFTGNKKIRMLKYFLEPAFLGKANPIYGIMPKSMLSDDVLNVLQVDTLSSDVLFLYNLLRKSEIRAIERTCLHKRIHSVSAGEAIRKSNANPNLWYFTKILHFLDEIIRGQIKKFLDFSKICKFRESLMLLILMPLSLVIEISSYVNWIYIKKCRS